MRAFLAGNISGELHLIHRVARVAGGNSLQQEAAVVTGDVRFVAADFRKEQARAFRIAVIRVGNEPFRVCSDLVHDFRDITSDTARARLADAVPRIAYCSYGIAI